MHISREKIQELALKWMRGQADPAEENMLFDWYNEHPGEDAFVDDASLYHEDDLREKMLANIADTAGMPFGDAKVVPLWGRTWFRIAASVIIVFTISAYLLNLSKDIKPVNTIAVTNSSKDIDPGGEKAVLTLANGSKVVLDEALNGRIGEEANVDIIKKDGKVSYIGKSDSEAIVYNTISTPRKGQYHLELADGTGVWLDAESSIRFPVAFSGDRRTVEVTGQAYFEVAKNAAMPFNVKVPLKDISVQVLGTHFNIMAYENEGAVKTTLLEGSVKVNSGYYATLLKPGQQASVKEAGSIQLINAGNTDRVMAWKNGMFNLGNTPIGEIMRQVARWYDAEIVYEGDVSKLVFSGEVSRKKNISELLAILEATGTIHFKIEDHRITVISGK